MSTRWTIAIHRCRGHYARVILAFFSAILWSAHNSESHAAPGCKTEVARIVSIQGVIELRRAQETHWQHAGLDEGVCAGDSVRVRSHSRAALRLSNDSMLRLDQKTSISFPEIHADPGTSLLDVLEGAIHIITRTPRPFKIRTPFANASVEGTEFFVGLEHDTTKVVVYEGKVLVSNDLGSIYLHDHEAAVALNGQVPRKEIIIRPTDAVHWALHYPAILDNWADKTPKAESAAAGLIRQAGRLLIVGQADEARAIIDQALELQPGNSDAYALLAIIAVTQNDKDQALDLATQAAVSEQRSAAGYLALSYAQQAHFDIDAALESVQKASALEPENALIWARLAELRMSVGDLDRSLEAAQHAVSVNPDIAKTHAVLGFAHLLQIDTQSAKTSFTQAITLDQADPMPRLGLGIALIREGELEAGRMELEFAASLDPANSLIRSYLGKAYFEEKRYSLASTQFDLAKERDPKDPTPWFYDAIQKQTQNRPVEALRDIQKSIELNDNRAVYRSKFLLDRDEAARGSSLARIFETLGFERRAVMETAKSLSFDPANHSAHRFLSDTYANTPRHEIARVSELLQAQLLQPINVNPVQPHMAVADLNIITNTGPSSTGFNEFTPLMERNKSQVVASGVVGNNSTLGNEIVLSKLYERTSISLGQFHYETNGFRSNNDQRHNIYNAFLQHALTSKLNLQFEARTREKEHGDLLLDFDKKIFSTESRINYKEHFARLGARYSISPQQNLIISTAYTKKNADNIFVSNPFDTPVLEAAKNTSYQIESQYLFSKNYFNTILGGSFTRLNRDVTTINTFYDENFNEQKETVTTHPTNQNHSFYKYSSINFFKDVSATLGFNYKSYNLGFSNKSENEVLPKLGLQWNINDKLRLRIAWFEAVKLDLVGQQTIEPTQVAGFNQLFDDPTGTKSQRKGIGLDGYLTNNFYGGFEASIRDLEVPHGSQRIEKQKEQVYRGYIYGLLNSNWAVTTELHFEKFSRNENPDFNGFAPHIIKTFSIPLKISYFNSNGLFSNFIGTYVNQFIHRLSRENSSNPQYEMWFTENQKAQGKSNFFLLDAIAGYRLPSRKGIISFEARNLLDEDFYFRSPYFFVAEPIAPRISPTRTFFMRLTLNF